MPNNRRTFVRLAVVAGATAPWSLTGLPSALGAPATTAPGPPAPTDAPAPVGIVQPGGTAPGRLTGGNSAGLYGGAWDTGSGYSVTGFLWRDGTLTVLPGSNQPNVITEDGVVVGDMVSHFERQAFRWIDGTYQALGYLGGTAGAGGYRSSAVAATRTGLIAGFSTTDSGQEHAFLWSAGAMRDLGTLGGPASSAVAVTGDGRVAGNSLTSAGQQHGFVWSRGTMQDLGTLGGPSTIVYAANRVGQIVGHSDTPDGHIHAFLWERGRLTDLGTLPGDTYSSAVDINDAGQVLVTTYGTANRAFVWQHGRIAEISVPGGDIEPVAINERGMVAGTATVPRVDGQGRAFRWQRGRLTTLATFGGPSSDARAITPTGVVLGSATTASSTVPIAAFWPYADR